MTQKAERVLVFGLLAGIFVMLVVLSMLSEGYPFGSENPTHYHYALYSWKYPEFFLYLWGRPLFTIIMSPVAQFGMVGIKILNSLFAVLTAFFAYLTMKRLEIRSPWLVIILVIFTPLYFYVIMSALTEVLFCFIFVLSLYLFFRERYIWSAIVISFLLFARLEGFIFFPLFLIAYILKRKYVTVPFVATGFLLFSVIGSFFTKDIFWVINRFPYGADHSIYDVTGTWYHYLQSWELFLGIPVAILFVAGIVYLLSRLFSGSLYNRWQAFYMILLILAPYLMYFFFHTILFWQGMGGSLGNIRHMSTVLPLASIVAMVGFSGITGWLPEKRWIRMLLLFTVIGSVIPVNFTTNYYPIPLGPEERIIKKACDWVKESEYGSGRFYCTAQDAGYFYGLDPFDYREGALVHDPETLELIPKNTVFVWDSHFGQNECEISREMIMEHPGFRLIAYFVPKQPGKTLGGYLYEVMVFLRSTGFDSISNYQRIDSILLARELTLEKVSKRMQDFDMPDSRYEKWISNKIPAVTGNYTFEMDADIDFGPGIVLTLDSLADYSELLFRASAYIYPTIHFSDNPASLVLSLERDGNSYTYAQVQFEIAKDLQPGRWNRILTQLYNDGDMKPGDVIKTYLWQRGQSTFYIDDLELVIFKPEDNPN